MPLPKSYGLSKGWVFGPGQGTPTIPAVIVDPGPTPLGPGPYLDPALYQSLGFAKRLVATHNTPLFLLRRTSDSATLSVSAATGSDYPDQAAIATWIGTSTAFVVRVYDQSGNGNDWVGTTTGEQPAYFPYRAQDNMPPIVFQGSQRVDVAVTGDRQNITILAAVQVPNPTNGYHWSLLDAYGAGKETICFTDFQSFAPITQYWNGTSNAISKPALYNPDLVLRATPSVQGYTSSPTERRVFISESSATSTPDTSSAVSKFTFGKALSTFNVYGNFASWGVAISKVALTNTVANADIATIATACAIPTTFTSRLVMSGDSIQFGQGALTQGTRDHVSMSYLIGKAKPSVELINIGRTGYRLDTEYAQRATAGPVSNINGLFTSKYGAGKCLLWIQSGTNDLAGTNDGANSSTPDDATLYTTATSFVAAEKTVGYKVLLSPILPRNDAAWNGTKETNRLAYRDRVVANTAAADVVIDIADPATAMGVASAGAETTLYTYQGTQLRKFAEAGGLGLHPTSYGYTLYSPIVVAALTTAGV